MKTAWLAAAAVLTAGAALASDAVETRQQGMKAVGAATKGLNDGLNGAASPAELKAYADRLAQLSVQSASWFPAGSGPRAGVKTKALAAIWSKPAEFAAARGAFVTAAGKLQAVAAQGDADAVKAEFGALRRTCKACHDGFKDS